MTKILLADNAEMHCKKGMCFSFYFGWYSIHLDIVRLEHGGWREGGGELLKGHSMLSVKKVVCRQSLKKTNMGNGDIVF